MTEPGATPSDAAASPDGPGNRLGDHLPTASTGRLWRRLDRLIVVVFCIGLLVPAVLLGAGVRPRLIENRPLVSPPRAGLLNWLDAKWYAALDRFLADNIALRPLAAEIRGEAYIRLGGTGVPGVVRGIDPWLFPIGEIRPRCGVAPAEIAAQLDRMRAAFTAAGQEFRFIVAPDKHAILPEALDPGTPYPAPCTDARRTAMRAELMSRTDFAIDGWAPVLAEKAARPGGPPLYFRQDSHWTPAGAIPAIRTLIQSFGPDLWQDADVAPGQPRTVKMDLAFLLGLPRTETVDWPVVRPGVHVVQTTVDLPNWTKAKAPVVRAVAQGDRPLLPGVTLVVYDSFFGRAIEQVEPFFADTIWLHKDDLEDHPDVIARLGPIDRVVLEVVERDLYRTKIEELLRPVVRSGP